MLTGGLEETTARFVMVRFVHMAHRLTWDEGSGTSPRSGTSLSAVSTAFGNGSWKEWEVGGNKVETGGR